MSRNKDYQHLLNSREWKELRLWKLQQNPLCERCQANGKVSAAVDIHHKVPVETATTLADMKTLCFNPSNLQSLCIPCHVLTHKEMGKSTRKNHIERTQQSLSRWIDKHNQKYGDQSKDTKDNI